MGLTEGSAEKYTEADERLKKAKADFDAGTINKDKLAPIFKVASFGYVGDALDIVPALTRKIRETRGAAATG